MGINYWCGSRFGSTDTIHRIYFLITHLDQRERRVVGSYPRYKGEWDNNAQGNISVYHIQNISISLFPIGSVRTFPPVSAINFKSRKMQIITLDVAQCCNRNCSIENTSWQKTGRKTSLPSIVQIIHCIILVVLGKNEIISWTQVEGWTSA